jgi:hypothetical protein
MRNVPTPAAPGFRRRTGPQAAAAPVAPLKKRRLAGDTLEASLPLPALRTASALPLRCLPQAPSVAPLRTRRSANGPATGTQTALHVAIAQGKLNLAMGMIVRLAHTPSLNAANACGQTPLHIAAANNYLQIMQALVDGGADLGAIDHQGDTPLHTAAAMGRSAAVLWGAANLPPGSGPCGEAVAAYPNPEHVQSCLHSTAQALRGPDAACGDAVYETLDAATKSLCGTEQDLNNDWDVFKYIGHLLGLDGKVVGNIAAEGWDHLGLLEQRLRSAVGMAVAVHNATPQTLVERRMPLPAAAMQAYLTAEIHMLANSIRIVRHIYAVRKLGDEARQVMLRTEAQHIVAQLTQQTQPAPTAQPTEIVIPLAVPKHAIYLSLGVQRAPGSEAVPGAKIVTLRLDNLGLGNSRAHVEQSERGKLSPCVVALEESHLHDAQVQQALVQLLAQLMGFMWDPAGDMGVIYTRLLLFVQRLQTTPAKDCVATRVQHDPVYWKNPQTVGNCSLKNHSAAVYAHGHAYARASLGPPAAEAQVSELAGNLWHWFKQQEIDQILDRMHNYVVTPKAMLERHEEIKARQLVETLQDDSPAAVAKLERFLAKPQRPTLGAYLEDRDVLPLVRSGRVQLMQQLFARGFCLQAPEGAAKSVCLLHEAVRSEAAEAPEMVALLLQQGASPEHRDATGESAAGLAVRLGRGAALEALIAQSPELAALREALQASLKVRLQATALELVVAQRRSRHSPTAAPSR